MDKRQIQIWVPDEVYKVVKDCADAKLLSVTDYCREALVRHITQYPAKGIIAEIMKNADS